MNLTDINNTGRDKDRLDSRLFAVFGLMAAIVSGAIIAELQNVSLLLAILAILGSVLLFYARKPFSGFIILYIATQLSGYRYHYGILTLRSDQLALIVVLIGWCFSFLRGKSRIYSTILNIPIAILLITGVISSYLFSPMKFQSYQSVFLQFVYILIYFFTVNVLLDNRKKIDWVVKFVMVVGVLHIVYAIVAQLFFLSGVYIGGISPSGRRVNRPLTSGFFQESDLLGAYAGMMIAIFAAHLFKKDGTGVFNLRVLIIAMMLFIYAAISSFARAPWIGIILIIIFYVFYAKPPKTLFNPRTVTFLISAALAFLVIIFPVLNFAYSEFSGKENMLWSRFQEILNFESGSGAGRVKVQEYALYKWEKHPVIGNGVLSLPREEVAEQVAAPSPWLYSSVIQSLHDTGLVGAACMLWIHIAPVIYALYASRKARTAERRAYLVGLSMGAVVMGVSSQSSSFFMLGFPWIYTAILVAIAKITLQEAETPRNDQLVLKHV